MNDEKENKVEVLAESLETYLSNKSYNDLARLIVKNIPKEYYNRLFWKLHCKNEEFKSELI